MTEPGLGTGRDRRLRHRFLIELPLCYRTLDRPGNQVEGRGRTINMSSRGVLFTTDHTLDPDQLLELSISWPAKLDDKHPLKLVLAGRLVRSGVGTAAVELHRHEFRIAGSQNLTGLARSPWTIP